MLTINIVKQEDYNIINKFLSKISTTRNLVSNSEIVMSARNNDEILGVGIVKLYEDYAEIIDIVTINKDKFELSYGIGKALINFIDRRFLKEVRCNNKSLQTLLESLSFKKNDTDIYALNLEGYFKNDCCR